VSPLWPVRRHAGGQEEKNRRPDQNLHRAQRNGRTCTGGSPRLIFTGAGRGALGGGTASQFARSARASIDPSPVASSNPGVAAKPGAPGTELSPWVMSWKTAGTPPLENSWLAI